MRASPQAAMRGLRAFRASAALALAVLAACLAPCGVGASGFDAAAQGRARARDTHRHRRAPSAPRPTSLSPTSAHVSGGAVLTIKGVGFEDTAGLAVRFAASSGAPDGGPLLHETRARFISRTAVECVAPRVATNGLPLIAHVSVSNGDGVWSAPPLVHVRDARTTRAHVALTLEYDDANPGCPGCGVGGFQSALAPARRARERWVAVPDVATTEGGSEITVRAVGYAINDPNDPFDETLVRDVRDVDAAALPPGWAALLGGAPSGGPGARGRGGASRGGVSPTAVTYGPRPRGTFLQGEGFRCRFECPIELAFPPDATPETRAATEEAFSDSFAAASSRPLSTGPFPFGNGQVPRDDAWRFYDAVRHEERTSVASKVGGSNGSSFETVARHVARRFFFRQTTARPGDARVSGAAATDRTSAACVAPPFPALPAAVAAALPANTTATVSRRCRIALSNDHGNAFDDGGFGNAARAAFRYSDAAPVLRGRLDDGDDEPPVSSFFPTERVAEGLSLLKSAATTPHVNAALSARGVTARGPAAGGTETTLFAKDLVPDAPEATCRFSFGSDAPAGPRSVATRAAIAPDGTSARCVSPPRPFRSGKDLVPGVGDADGKDGVASARSALSSAAYPPTLTHEFGSPGCFFASVALSNDGVTFSNASAAFLYCDVHVAPLGEDVDPALAFGTPSRPFPNARSALSAALRGARRDDDDDDVSPSFVGKANVKSTSRWLNRDVLRLAPGVYGGEGNVELAVASDQIVDARAAGDDDDGDDAKSDGEPGDRFSTESFFLLAKKRRAGASSFAVTVVCGGDRPLFASTRTSTRVPNAAGGGGGGVVSFSRSVFFEGCHFDGREAVTGTRCASRGSPHGGCAGDDAYVLPARLDAVGGRARDPSSWEAFDYDDALEYGGTRGGEAFYDFA